MKVSEYVGDTLLIGNMEADIRKLAEDGEQIDLADCKLTPDVANEILNQIKLGADIIDSKDKDRDNLIKYNQAVIRELRESNIEYVAPPSYDRNIVTLKDYLDLFKDGEYYNLSLLNVNDDFKCALGFMLLACRVEVNIIFTETDMPKFIKYVSSKIFTKDRQGIIDSTDNFFLLIGNDICPCTLTSKNLDSQVSVYPIEGTLTINELISEHFLVPDYFGEIQILESKHLKELYIDALVDVRREIASHMNANKSLYITLKQMQ